MKTMSQWRFVFLEVGVLCLSVFARCVFGRDSHVICEEGSAKSSMYVTDYIVKKRPSSEFLGCQRMSDVQAESPLPPGKPRILVTTLVGSALTVDWSPPDDGSVLFLTGFLVEIYMYVYADTGRHVSGQDTGEYLSGQETGKYASDQETGEYLSGPDACYTVQLVERAKQMSHFEASLLQDSVFSLSCNLSGVEHCAQLDIYVTTFPLPNRTNIIKTETVTVGNCGKWSPQSMRPKTTGSNTSAPLMAIGAVSADKGSVQSLSSGTAGSSTLVPLVTISAGVLVVMVSTALVIVICRKRSRQESAETPSTANNISTDVGLAESKLMEHLVSLPETTLLDKQDTWKQMSSLPPAYCECGHGQKSIDRKFRHDLNSHQEHLHDRESLHQEFLSRNSYHKHCHDRYSMNHELNNIRNASDEGATHLSDKENCSVVKTCNQQKNKTVYQEHYHVQTTSSRELNENGNVSFPDNFRKFAIEINQEI